MMIWGKVIGTLLGYLVARLPGAAIGFILGYFFDEGLKQHALLGKLFSSEDKRKLVQGSFFKATFTVMGHVAKSDGSVTEEEVKNIEKIMQQMQIVGEARTEAIAYFNLGKKSDFVIDEVLNELREACKKNKALLQVFIEMQLQAAYVDGILADSKRAILIYVSERLGIDRSLFSRLNAMHQAEDKFREYMRQQYQQKFQKMRNTSAISEAYKVFSLDPQASDAQVKKAYRKLMSLHHPDKLIAQGLPEAMIKHATEKTQEIQKAYEAIMDERNRGKVL
jgi:DnaJ like chaperone protein